MCNFQLFLEEEKVSLFDLNKALNLLLPFSAVTNVPKLTQSNIESLKAMQRRSWELNEKIDNVIHRAAMPRCKRAKYVYCEHSPLMICMIERHVYNCNCLFMCGVKCLDLLSTAMLLTVI